MRSVNKIYKRYYISLYQRKTIFESVSDVYYVPYYSVYEGKYLINQSMALKSDVVERLFLSKNQVNRIIGYHKDKNEINIDWVLLNFGRGSL